MNNYRFANKNVIRFLSLSLGILFLISCGTTTKFPVSTLAPAADITAITKLDENNNKVITIKAKNLASPDRIDPNANAYVIWIETQYNEIRSLGQLQNKNADKAELTTVTPYDIDQIFITAETQGNVLQPAGAEIARVEIPAYVFEPDPPVENLFPEEPAQPFPDDPNQPVIPDPTSPTFPETPNQNENPIQPTETEIFTQPFDTIR